MRNFATRRRTDTANIEDEIAHLRGLDLKGLREHWHNQFGRAPPMHLSQHLLFRIIAYRLQAARFGDLDAKTLKVLKAAANPAGRSSPLAKTLANNDQRRYSPPPGTVLVREWNSESHQVMVLSEGFAWNGQTFASLSQVAFAITGTRWNGPRFFGLRDGERPTSSQENQDEVRK